MIRLRLATEAGIQEITPASLTHCAGCEQEYYLDGPADPDPAFCCEVYDRRTDRCRLPECIRATNPVIVEGCVCRRGMPVLAGAQHGGRLFPKAPTADRV